MLVECVVFRQRPYHVESTASRPISEVKQRRARLVLGWETAWEHRVLLAFTFFFYFLIVPIVGMLAFTFWGVLNCSYSGLRVVSCIS